MQNFECVIDRIEKNIAVLEMQTRKRIELPTELLPAEAKEGDVIEIEIKLNIEKTKERQKLSEDDFFNVFSGT